MFDVTQAAHRAGDYLAAGYRRGGAVGGAHTWLDDAASSAAGAGCSFRAADLERIREFVSLMRRLMFPGYFEPEPVPAWALDVHCRTLAARSAELLVVEVAGVMAYARAVSQTKKTAVPDAAAPAPEPADVVTKFLERLPEVSRLLSLDVQAAFDGDPAAEHSDEVILCYPGIEAIFSHRIAHELYTLRVPLLPRAISEEAHSRTGIDIHPGASIGESFFIDHGSATVIGETATIGRGVKIYQGVTLGARSFPKDERGRVIRGAKRHPTIGDRVTIYAGAVILGGDTVIGDDCVIAGGVLVLQSVPPGHVVQQPRAEPTLRAVPGKG
jgi:serine O-acetyltransferase